MEIVRTDFLIVGSGIAGLYSAIQAQKFGKTIVITKQDIRESSTEYAQGGIAAVLSPEDSPELHFKDTIRAGAGLCNEEAVRILVTEGPERIRELMEIGVKFDTVHGHISLTREGAHSRNRILHAHGDATGAEIHRALIHYVMDELKIPVLEEQFILDLIKSEGRVIGVLVMDRLSGKITAYLAAVTILATGGAGQLYYPTTNPFVSTGDGYAVAFRNGASLMDMEFVQFHPTVFTMCGVKPFLISEAVRGEGAVLRNAKGERFMTKYHELADLAPRDIVARAIVEEMRKEQSKNVWLDITHKSAEFLKNRFPGIYSFCLSHGLDMSKDLIPVAPAAHYFMGGVKIDLFGRTDLPGLYACGEVSCSGVHGANRLASNSLLDGLVFGYRIFQGLDFDEVKSLSAQLENVKIEEPYLEFEASKNPKQVRNRLQEIMTNYVGIVRELGQMQEALQEIEDLDKSFVPAKNVFSLETKNLLQLAKVVIKSALAREESRGSHFRKDFPQQNENLEKQHSIIKLNKNVEYIRL